MNSGPCRRVALLSRSAYCPQHGELDRELTAAQQTALRTATKVAVSLEPAGGSTTGAPTGPVLYVAPLQPVAS